MATKLSLNIKLIQSNLYIPRVKGIEYFKITYMSTKPNKEQEDDRSCTILTKQSSNHEGDTLKYYSQIILATRLVNYGPYFKVVL